jgi:hypothetical protein
VSSFPLSACSILTHDICSIVRKSADWYKRSQFNDRVRECVEHDGHRLTPHLHLQYDIGLCAYTSLLRIVAKFHEELFSDPDTATGLNKVTRNLQDVASVASQLTTLPDPDSPSISRRLPSTTMTN